MSKNASGKGRALLEHLLEDEKIEECFNKNFNSEVEAVQMGLRKWTDSDPTWEPLFKAMEDSEIGVQHQDNLKKELIGGNVSY